MPGDSLIAARTSAPPLIELREGMQLPALIFFAATIIAATSFEYLWFGGIPGWLILTSLAAGVAAFGVVGSATNIVLRSYWKSLILPWLAFVFLVTLIELSRGSLELSLSKRTLLNLATLGLLLTCAIFASRLRTSSVLYVLALIGAMQGALCIGQYTQTPGAWEMPERIARLTGANLSREITEDTDYSEVGRVRGTNPFVHKFNAMQGVLAVFLFTALMANAGLQNILKLRSAIFLPLALVTAAGMFLTFSRSTLFGALVGACLVLIRARKIGATVALAAFLAFAYYGLSKLEVTDAPQFTRLIDPSRTESTNVGRLQQYWEALGSFARNPLVGQESTLSPTDVPVHSVLLRIFAEYGLLGGVPYLFVVGGLATLFWRAGSQKASAASAIGLAAFCAFLTSLLDAWTHSSGLLFRDIAQPALTGTFLGMTTKYYMPSLDRQPVATLEQSIRQRPANFL